MQKLLLVVILALLAYSGCLLAATPTFQLTPIPVRLPRFMELDSDVMINVAEDVDNAIQIDGDVLADTAAARVFGPPEKLVDFAVMEEAVLSDRTESFHNVNFMRSSNGEHALKNIFTNKRYWSGSLYIFLKDLRMRSDQKSKSWSVLLIVLFFVLYWGRRRPARTYLRLHSESKGGQAHSI